MASLDDNIARLVAQREKDQGELEEEQLAKNKFRRDVIPSPGTALPGVRKSKKPTATITSVERSRILNETKIIQDLMEKMYPWMYKKPADEKGTTKVAKRVATDVEKSEEKKTPDAKKTVSTFGKILGALALIGVAFALFKDKLKELWEAIKTKIGELFDKFPGLFKLAIRGLLAAPLTALKLAMKGVSLGVKLLLNPLGAMLDILKGLGSIIVKGVGAAIKGVVAAVKGVGSIVGKIFGITAKTAASTGGKIAAKGAEAAAKKQAGKSIGKSAGKSLLKKIPGVGLLAGIGFGIARAAKGDFVGAVGELASGAASTIPGVGTAASVAIDVGLAARDLKKASESATSEMVPEEIEDGIIKPDGGLLVQGKKGMFKLAKTDSVIAGELPNTGRKDNTLTRIGKSLFSPFIEDKRGKRKLNPLALMNPLAPTFLASKTIFDRIRERKEEREKKRRQEAEGRRISDTIKESGEKQAKPLSDYLNYKIKQDKDMIALLGRSNKTLEEIEKNTRGGMGPTIMPPGQKQTAAPPAQSSGSNNSVMPNINANTGGARKLDSRSGYLNSAYSVTPNTLVT